MTHPGSDEKQAPCLLASSLVYSWEDWEEQKRHWEEHRYREGPMPRVPLYALIWSRDQGCYALYMQDRLVQQVQPGDEAAWLAWLREVSSFAFRGVGGSLNVYLEVRSPGGRYWYGYHTSRDRTRKRYLGRTETLSLARLEETARALGPDPEVAQALACRAGGAGAFALFARWGAFDSANARLRSGRLWQNDAAFDLGQ